MCGSNARPKTPAVPFHLKVEKDTGLNKHPKFLLSAVHAICGADSGGPGMLLEEVEEPGTLLQSGVGFSTETSRKVSGRTLNKVFEYSGFGQPAV